MNTIKTWIPRISVLMSLLGLTAVALSTARDRDYALSRLGDARLATVEVAAERDSWRAAFEGVVDVLADTTNIPSAEREGIASAIDDRVRRYSDPEEIRYYGSPDDLRDMALLRAASRLRHAAGPRSVPEPVAQDRAGERLIAEALANFEGFLDKRERGQADPDAERETFEALRRRVETVGGPTLRGLALELGSRDDELSAIQFVESIYVAIGRDRPISLSLWKIGAETRAAKS